MENEIKEQEQMKLPQDFQTLIAGFFPNTKYFDSRFDLLQVQIDESRRNQEQIKEQLRDFKSDTDKRFEQVDKRFEQVDKRFEAITNRFDKRFEQMFSLVLSLFGSLMILIIAVLGYSIWDRRTITKKVSERVKKVEHDLDIKNIDGSRLMRLIAALKDLAKENRKLAEVLRSFNLL